MAPIRKPCRLRHFGAGGFEQQIPLPYDDRQIGIRNTTARSVPAATSGPGWAECPHVVRHQRRDYIASLLPSLKGIQDRPAQVGCRAGPPLTLDWPQIS